MAKIKSAYICQKCAYESAKWLGQCPDCGEWNSFVETVVETKSGSLSLGGTGYVTGGLGSGSVTISGGTKPIYLSSVRPKQTQRVKTGIEEFDRVIGGGFVQGQVILLAGDPGIGKSTLLTQIAEALNRSGELEKRTGELTKKISKTSTANSKSPQKKIVETEQKVCYIGGEESPEQIKLRVERMGYKADNLLVISEIDVGIIIGVLENIVKQERIGLLIVDSIQTLSSGALSGISGSVGQVRLCSQLLAQLAKRHGIPTILVGHVTKDGTVAGPKVLEHLVDTVLYLEGDAQHMYRILKTTKNRFGPVSEVGIFEMGDTGLREVTNPSEMLLSQKQQNVSGSCVTVVMEGYRPLLFEIQALSTRTPFGYPRRTTSGFNVNRLQVLIAILEKRAHLDLANFDVYINVAGGFKVSEYAADLAVCLAIASSVKDKPLKNGLAVFGECGLLGEVRRVSYEDKRVKEAKKLGYKNVLSPANIKYVGQALKVAFE